MLDLVIRLEELRSVYCEVLEGDLEKAQTHLAAAQDLCPSDSPLRAQLLHTAGNLKKRQGHHAEARRLMEAGYDLKTRYPAVFNEASLAYSLHGLANLHSDMQMPSAAGMAYREAISKKRHYYGSPCHLDVARSEVRYAQSLGSNQEELIEATQMLEGVLTVYKAFLNEDQFEVTSAREIYCKKVAQWQTGVLLMSPSWQHSVLSAFFNPGHIGGPESRYYATMDDAPPKTREFMRAFEASRSFQGQWLSNFQPRFATHAKQFATDGLLILPSYIDAPWLSETLLYLFENPLVHKSGFNLMEPSDHAVSIVSFTGRLKQVAIAFSKHKWKEKRIGREAKTLDAWHHWYEETMERVGTLQPDLHMQTFTATSHDGVELSDAVLRSISDPRLAPGLWAGCAILEAKLCLDSLSVLDAFPCHSSEVFACPADLRCWRWAAAFRFQGGHHLPGPGSPFSSLEVAS